MDGTTLRHRIADLVSEATGGALSAADVLAADSLVALGVDSLALLRLVDAIELEYGVEIELSGGGQRLDRVDDLVAVVAGAGPDGPDRVTTAGTTAG
jgi:acyl carrier protein